MPLLRCVRHNLEHFRGDGRIGAVVEQVVPELVGAGVVVVEAPDHVAPVAPDVDVLGLRREGQGVEWQMGNNVPLTMSPKDRAGKRLTDFTYARAGASSRACKAKNRSAALMPIHPSGSSSAGSPGSR